MSTSVIELIPAVAASDGDGVKLLRVFGGRQPERFDPFLLMDEFGSDEASDYIGGFPPHPHRGFETITIMLNGKMQHTDHLGNVGLLNDGDVQWMTAGKGVIHSEMPQQTEGLMRGFQLWLNLPAAEKLKPAAYQDIKADDIPVYKIDGASIRLTSGELGLAGKSVKGHIDSGSTEAILAQIDIEPNVELVLDIPETHNAMVYTYEGELSVGEKATEVRKQHLARLKHNGKVSLKNEAAEPLSIVFIAGKPIKEPIVQYGPFVMNTQEEVEQAIADYRTGVLFD